MSMHVIMFLLVKIYPFVDHRFTVRFCPIATHACGHHRAHKAHALVLTGRALYHEVGLFGRACLVGVHSSLLSLLIEEMVGPQHGARKRSMSRDMNASGQPVNFDEVCRSMAFSSACVLVFFHVSIAMPLFIRLVPIVNMGQ